MSNVRKVEALRNDEFVEVHMSNLKQFEYFRMFEPSGEQVYGEEGESIFYTISEPYYSDTYNTWTVDIGRPLN